MHCSLSELIKTQEKVKEVFLEFGNKGVLRTFVCPVLLLDENTLLWEDFFLHFFLNYSTCVEINDCIINCISCEEWGEIQLPWNCPKIYHELLHSSSRSVRCNQSYSCYWCACQLHGQHCHCGRTTSPPVCCKAWCMLYLGSWSLSLSDVSFWIC